jgi:arylformamidase
VVVYAHGGGWLRGDKVNRITDKVNLFTGAGYVFVSINYRLSPQAVTSLEPNRVKHPDHAHDVGEALGWLDRNVARYGGNPERMALIGHSAGAHLVSLVGSDPRYAAAYGVARRQLRGVVSLDTAAFDVAAKATPGSARARSLLLFWNAFGTPGENATSGSWRDASPLAFADASDPPFLLVTQSAPARVAENARMADSLGQPGAVLPVPLSHSAINAALGAPGDTSGVTRAVMAFVERAFAAGRPPRAIITGHPRRALSTSRRRTRVTFRFRANRRGARFECRLGRRAFRRCRSPRSYALAPGRHRFAVRALSGAGSPGRADSFRFRIVRALP